MMSLMANTNETMSRLESKTFFVYAAGGHKSNLRGRCSIALVAGKWGLARNRKSKRVFLVVK